MCRQWTGNHISSLKYLGGKCTKQNRKMQWYFLGSVVQEQWHCFSSCGLGKSCQGLGKHSCKAVLNVMCAAMRFNCIANIFLVTYVSSDAESEKNQCLQARTPVSVLKNLIFSFLQKFILKQRFIKRGKKKPRQTVKSLVLYYSAEVRCVLYY